MPKTSELCPNISLSVFAAQLVTGPAKGGRGGGLAAMGNPGVGRGKVYPMASEDHCSTLPCAGGNARMQSLVVKVKHYHPVPPHGICSAVGAGSNPVAEAAQEATQGQPCHIGRVIAQPPITLGVITAASVCRLQYKMGRNGFLQPCFSLLQPSRLRSCSPGEERGWVGVWHLV